MSSGQRLRNLSAYDLHKTLINEYFLTAKERASLFKRDTSRDKRDIDVIKENHQFLWNEEEEANLPWEKKLAKKYYDKLYKEYCIGDLSRYKENKIGMRWRTEKELIDGKGQFSCGNKRCSETDDLRTWEVNFSYVEHGVKKNALVKLRLCPECSHKLNYHHKKKEVKRLKKTHHLRKENLDKLQEKEEKEKNKDESNAEILECPPDESQPVEKETNESDIWKQTQAEEEDEGKTREEEFDEYLEQLFL